MVTMDPNTTPALPPPDGIESNFENPPTLMPALIAGTTLIHLTTFLFIAARLFVVLAVTKKPRVEDYLAILAYLCLIGYTGAIMYAETLGMEHHMWDITLAMLPDILRTCNTVFCFYTAAGGFAKTVVFLQIKRIFTTPHRGVVFWVIVCSLVANAIFYTAMLLLYIFTCWPREKIWNPTVEGRCIDSNRLNMAMGVLNVISDVEAFLVPAWAIWQLNMKLKQKISVFVVFSVGAVAVAIGIVGLYYRIILLQRPDFTWLLSQAGQICMAELAIVIIVGCCPYIPRLRLHLMGREVSTTGGNGYSRQPSAQRSNKSKNTWQMYRTSDSKMTELGESVSEEHLEMHHYAHGSDKGSAEKVEGIVRTTHVSQSISPR
ncbi:hypothetical protein EJ04DRAFT_547175 [Polyplosphaeria fusca]|uniref:Rhodopsin domain-containing protein n=1 Tax=Polyplosphaeria fusca TaxID=682080 RepID=A0A9P4QMT3_9PLEO|nr:hypothetical protein EJ04DRAFT_547175 [Polyplosphaeria fusca]